MTLAKAIYSVDNSHHSNNPGRSNELRNDVQASIMLRNLMREVRIMRSGKPLRRKKKKIEQAQIVHSCVGRTNL